MIWFACYGIGLVLAAVLYGWAFAVALGMGFGKASPGRQRYVSLIMGAGGGLTGDTFPLSMIVNVLIWTIAIGSLLRGLYALS